MSKENARIITDRMSVPWKSEGLNHYNKWVSEMKTKGQYNKNKDNISSFESYLSKEILSSTSSSKRQSRRIKDKKSKMKKTVDNDDDDDDVILLDLSPATNLESTIEASDEHLISAMSRASSSGISMERELFHTGDTTEEESSQLIEDIDNEEIYSDSSSSICIEGESESDSGLMNLARSLSSKRDHSDIDYELNEGLESGNYNDSGDKYNDDDDEEEEEEEEGIGFGNNTSKVMMNQTINSIYEVSSNPISTLHLLSSKHGQYKLRNNIEHCCMQVAKENAGRFVSSSTEEFNAYKASKMGCQHFNTHEMANEPALKHISNIYSVLVNSKNDDSVSSIIATESLNELSDIRDISHSVSKAIDELLKSGNNTKDILEEGEDIVSLRDMNDIMESDIFSLSNHQLHLIEKNYEFSKSVAFSSWGRSSLKSDPSKVNRQASKLASNVIKLLHTGRWKKYDAYKDNIFLGFRASITFLASLLAHLHENIKSKNIARKSVAKRTSETLSDIMEVLESGNIPANSGLLLFEAPGKTESKRRGGRKIKKILRRGSSKGSKLLMLKRELSIIQTNVKEASVAYNRALARKRTEEARNIITSEEKNSIASAVVIKKANISGKRMAKRMFTSFFHRLSVSKSSLFDIYDMTLRVIGLSIAHIIITKESGYDPISTNPNVKKNVQQYMAFLQGKVSETSGIFRSNSSTTKQKNTFSFFKSHAGVLDTVEDNYPFEIPNTYANAKDSLLDENENIVFKKSLGVLRDYLDNTKLKGKENASFVIIVPYKRKFRNSEQKAIVMNYAHHFVKEISSSNEEEEEEEKSNHQVWSTLPSRGSFTQNQSLSRHVSIFKPDEMFVIIKPSGLLAKKPIAVVKHEGRVFVAKKKYEQQAYKVSSIITPRPYENELSLMEKEMGVSIQIRHALGSIKL